MLEWTLLQTLKVSAKSYITFVQRGWNFINMLSYKTKTIRYLHKQAMSTNSLMVDAADYDLPDVLSLD
jgi:hypothetical protein